MFFGEKTHASQFHSRRLVVWALMAMGSLIAAVGPEVAWAQLTGNGLRTKYSHSGERFSMLGSFQSETTLLAEESRPTWTLSALGTFQISDRLQALLDVEFQSLYHHEDADPDVNQGIGDVSLALMWPSLRETGRLGRLVAYTSLSLPTSEVSRRESKIIGTSSYLRLLTPLRGPILLRRLTFLSQLTLDMNHFEYDLSSVMGGEFNSPLRTAETLGLGVRFFSSLNWHNLYTYGQRYDYSGHWIPYQGFTSKLAYDLEKTYQIVVGYRWSERIFTEDLPFNPRKAALFGELNYAF